MRKLFCLAALATAAVCGLPALAPAQKETGPTIEVRIRSVSDLVDKLEYLGGVANQAEQAKQLVGVVKAFTDAKKGIEGVDPAQPFGLYGSVTTNVVDSPVVVLIPVADETAFLGLLTGKLNLDPKKNDDGVYTVQVPNVPVPVLFRFADGYAHVTVQTDAAIAPKKLIAPKVFFADKDDAAIASVKVHVNRLPDDIKKTVLGQFELKANDAKARTEPGETPAQKKLRGWAIDQLTAVIKSALADGKVLGARLNVSPDSDDLAAEITFTGKDGSSLAEWITAAGGQTSVPAALAALAKNPLFGLGLKFALPSAAKTELAPIIDALIQEAIDNAKDMNIAKKVMEAITPTLKAGNLETGLVVTGPDAAGKIRLVGSVKATDGTAIAKLLEEFAPVIPADKAKIEIGAKKVGDVTLHKLTIEEPKLEAVFGSKTVWIGTSDTLVLLSLEEDGKSIEAAAKQKAETVSPVESVLAVARMFGFTEQALNPDQLKKLVTETFGAAGSTGRDTVTFKVTGGSALTVSASMKGKALKIAVLVDQEKKKK